MPVIKNVEVLFSNVVNTDDYNNKYNITVGLTEEQYADAEAEGINVKTKEYEGKTQYQAKFATKFRPRVVGSDPSRDYDLEGQEIGRGSTISVQYREREWTHGGKQGTSRDLVAVQILSLKTQGKMEFDEVGDSEFGDDY